ncbi:8-amino-7-oxononanoate synthase [mine drainage metagenome]|uniref:8-amino-7-oxononanoate synthase n=1 Tax=mine drainage metagenome TaxID=410659 RepID=A0A1J5R847_9ZZZZ
MLGEHGRGSASHDGLRGPRLVYMATLGKAAGVAGAFVAGADAVVETILQRARSYTFATAAPPLVVETVRAALPLIAADDWRRERLRELIGRWRAGAGELPTGWRLADSDTPIQPLLIGDNAAALRAMAALWEQGLWVPAIRPPTVPAGTARLRLSLSAAHSADDVDRLLRALGSLPR